MSLLKELNARRIIDNVHTMVEMRTIYPYAFTIVPLPNHSALSVLRPYNDSDYDEKFYILSSEGLTKLTKQNSGEHISTKDILSKDCLRKIYDELPEVRSDPGGTKTTQIRCHNTLLKIENYAYGLAYFRDYNPRLEEKFINLVEDVNNKYSPETKNEYFNIS